MVNEATVPSMSLPDSATAIEAASSTPEADVASVTGRIVLRRDRDRGRGRRGVGSALVVHRGVVEARRPVPVGIGHEEDGRRIAARRNAVVEARSVLRPTSA